MLEQFAFLSVRVAAPRLEPFGVRKLPEIVVLQTPERILRMIGLPAWAELHEQFTQIAIHFSVGDHPRLGAEQATNSVERKQRFVRRPFPASFPHRYGTE